ncbi:MAG: hypothetical protein CFE32_21495 [Alphaproteobacteria bacterium PA3]|nr:MAG: hypothetical protein CFE32_21495 [Alphaproteobacteria bacterium PA3]
MMVTESGTSAEALIDHGDEQLAESPERRKRRVKVRVKRKQELFPRWVRVSLWVGLPILLWVGVYLIGIALL